eukprot:2159486-Prymnesium_polylepis.1
MPSGLTHTLLNGRPPMSTSGPLAASMRTTRGLAVPISVLPGLVMLTSGLHVCPLSLLKDLAYGFPLAWPSPASILTMHMSVLPSAILGERDVREEVPRHAFRVRTVDGHARAVAVPRAVWERRRKDVEHEELATVAQEHSVATVGPERAVAADCRDAAERAWAARERDVRREGCRCERAVGLDPKAGRTAAPEVGEWTRLTLIARLGVTKVVPRQARREQVELRVGDARRLP